MFLGKYSSALDKENRLPLPSTFREELQGGIYLTQGFDRNLMVLTISAFQEMYARIRSLNIADPLARALLRMILGTTYASAGDQADYVTIPNDLKDFSQIDQDVLIVGQGDYFELWSPNIWNRQEVLLRDAETNTNRFSTLTVTTR